MTEPSPKPLREVKIDLSGLSERQALVREHVLRLGEFAFGARWQSDLAAAISKEAGRTISQAQVAHWISGRRPVPEALIEPLQRLAARIAADLVRRADMIRGDWVEAKPEA